MLLKDNTSDAKEEKKLSVSFKLLNRWSKFLAALPPTEF